MFKPQVPARMAQPPPVDDFYNTDPAAPSSDPWTTDELNSARDYYLNFISQNRIPTSWGDVRDPMGLYQEQRAQGAGHDQALQFPIGYLGWNAPMTAGGGTSSGSGGGGGQAGGGFVNSGKGLFDPALYAPWTGTPPSYTSPTLAAVPSFDTYYDVGANPIPTYQAPVYRGPGMTKK